MCKPADQNHVIWFWQSPERDRTRRRKWGFARRGAVPFAWSAGDTSPAAGLLW